MNASHPPRWCRISVSTRVMRVLKGIHRAILIGGRPARVVGALSCEGKPWATSG